MTEMGITPERRALAVKRLALLRESSTVRCSVEHFGLGNFLRRLALPASVKHWSLTTLREKLIKIGAKVATHSRYVIFQMAEVAVPRKVFAAILARLRRWAAKARAGPVDAVT